VIDITRKSLVKPTLATHYHVDFAWWQNNDRDWRVYLQGCLCSYHQEMYAQEDLNEQVDWIDPDTAEVQRVDGLQHVLITHCARQAEFRSQQIPLVDSVFRIFLANGNIPLSPIDLGQILGRDPNLILRTLSGSRVYKGLRPLLD
jgi:hypothetical protein